MFEDANVGDRVWGIRRGWGTIVRVDRSTYPVTVTFDSGENSEFTINGKHLIRDLYPSLFWDEIKIVPPPRPKRKVKKTLNAWINIYPNDATAYFRSEYEANRFASSERIACVKLTGEYEVEE